MTDFETEFGESFVGSGPDAAHLNTVLGAKGGPVETAWTTALATPRPGHAAFVTILRPGIPAKPMTLFVNKATVTDPKHSGLTWGPAQAGVASGVMWAVADGIVDASLVDDLLLICAVWVSPEADDEGSVYANNREATRRALESGKRHTPTLDEVMAVRDAPLNGYYLPPGTV
ncbi:MAG: formaldehyde-activating enzyme [Acidimicrobiales bacterium]